MSRRDCQKKDLYVAKLLKETLDDYVGHFEETQKENGNIGLAAHNRGYKNNYFENIKKLKEDDSIFYNYKGKIKEYKVEKISIIKDTDWNCLENTEKNIITLIIYFYFNMLLK